MGLRDRLAANYYLPLVAGVPAAASSGVLAPADVYGPGLFVGGSIGGVGGIGLGDGGTDPVDLTITQPTIISPSLGAVDVAPDATATSSAFASTNGQTQIKARWVIEYRGDGSDTATAAYVMYDSGPTTTDLTSLDLALASLGRDAVYAIKVRYKGSDGGWSAWSEYSVFTALPCLRTQYVLDAGNAYETAMYYSYTAAVTAAIAAHGTDPLYAGYLSATEAPGYPILDGAGNPTSTKLRYTVETDGFEYVISSMSGWFPSIASAVSAYTAGLNAQSGSAGSAGGAWSVWTHGGYPVGTTYRWGRNLNCGGDPCTEGDVSPERELLSQPATLTVDIDTAAITVSTTPEQNCVTFEEPVTPPPAPPPPAPVPPPPPPPPAPAPPALPPVALDLTNSILLPITGQPQGQMTLAAAIAAGGAESTLSQVDLFLVLQNTGATVASTNVRVTSSNSYVQTGLVALAPASLGTLSWPPGGGTYNGATKQVQVPIGAWATLQWRFVNTQYTPQNANLTIDTGTGSPLVVKVRLQGAYNPAFDTPCGYCG